MQQMSDIKTYPNKGLATLAMKRMGNHAEEYEVRECAGGFGIFPVASQANEGKPDSAPTQSFSPGFAAPGNSYEAQTMNTAAPFGGNETPNPFGGDMRPSPSMAPQDMRPSPSMTPQQEAGPFADTPVKEESPFGAASPKAFDSPVSSPAASQAPTDNKVTVPAIPVIQTMTDGHPAEQNGIKRPALVKSDGKPNISGLIWQLGDKFSAEAKRPISLNELVVECLNRGISSFGTISAQYSRWRKYYGISGRYATEEEREAAKQRKAERAERQAERQAALAKRVVKNGIARPSEDTKGAAIWGIMDKLSSALRRPITREEAIKAPELETFNPGTVTAQWFTWCRFYGLMPVAKQVTQMSREELLTELERLDAKIRKLTIKRNKFVESINNELANRPA